MASATGNLCEAANSVVQGQAQEEKLIAAAKAVASSTAQLLIACQVKADTRSENNRRLQVCQYASAVHLCVDLPEQAMGWLPLTFGIGSR